MPAGDDPVIYQSADMSLCGTLGMLLSAAAAILCGISLSLNTWGHGAQDEGIPDLHMGIFKFCRDEDNEKCESYIDSQFDGVSTEIPMVTRTRACQAFIIMDIVFSVWTISVLVFSLSRKPEENPSYTKAINDQRDTSGMEQNTNFWSHIKKMSYLQFICAGLVGISLCIFGDILVTMNHDDNFKDRFDFSVGAGWTTAMVAFACNLLAGLALLCDYMENPIYVDGEGTVGGPGRGCCNQGML